MPAPVPSPPPGGGFKVAGFRDSWFYGMLSAFMAFSFYGVLSDFIGFSFWGTLSDYSGLEFRVWGVGSPDADSFGPYWFFKGSF